MWNVIKAVSVPFSFPLARIKLGVTESSLHPEIFFWKIPQNGVFWTHVVIMLGGIFNHFCKIVKEKDRS